MRTVVRSKHRAGNVPKNPLGMDVGRDGTLYYGS
jgi:hypothetical protein